MKLNMKRVLLMLCMVTCLLSLSACAKKADDSAAAVDPSVVAGLEQLGNQTLQQFASMLEEDIETSKEEAVKGKSLILATGLDSWATVRPDLGELISIDSTTVEKVEEGYMIVMDATFEIRKMEFRMGVNEEVSDYTSISFNPVYTLGENMHKGFLNMVVGMGTVFIVLILISILIGCFKYIHAWEERKKGTVKVIDLPAAPVVIPAEEELTDDLELVAVITAAIAAAGNTSADGLVVRSIRRAQTSKWKRA